MKSPFLQDHKRLPILVLVICPTMELASQVVVQANVLFKYHENIVVQVVSEGTKLPRKHKWLQKNSFQILVATPGRLWYHIENSPAISNRLMSLKMLVLR